MLTKSLGLPEAFSNHGPLMDHMLDIIQWFALALGIGWSIFFVIVLFRFWRGRGQRASYSGVRNHASTHLEIGVVMIEAMLLLGFAFPLWAERVDEFPDGPDVVHCRVIAYQFNWRVHYPGEDGIFGATDPRLFDRELSDADLPEGIDKALADRLRTNARDYGIVPTDPNGFDDVVSSTLFVPEGHPVVMYITSKDVIHNVAIVAMRVGLDAIPGVTHRFHFTPTAVGDYEIICGQLCGDNHAGMKGVCKVVSAEEWAESYSHYDDAEIGTEAPAADEDEASMADDAEEPAASGEGEVAAR